MLLSIYSVAQYSGVNCYATFFLGSLNDDEKKRCSQICMIDESVLKRVNLALRRFDIFIG